MQPASRTCPISRGSTLGFEMSKSCKTPVPVTDQELVVDPHRGHPRGAGKRHPPLELPGFSVHSIQLARRAHDIDHSLVEGAGGEDSPVAVVVPVRDGPDHGVRVVARTAIRLVEIEAGTRARISIPECRMRLTLGYWMTTRPFRQRNDTRTTAPGEPVGISFPLIRSRTPPELPRTRSRRWCAKRRMGAPGRNVFLKSTRPSSVAEIHDGAVRSRTAVTPRGRVT
jgi:hypothetical protein